MSSLKTILHTLPPDLQGRYTHHVDKLIGLGIHTVHDLQEHCIDDLVKQSIFSLYDLHQLYQDFSYYSSIRSCSTAATLWEQEQRPAPQLMVTTGNASIDNALQSKLAYNEITEVYGLQVMDKFEIVLNILLSVKEKVDREVIVNYIDICRDFDAHRLRDLYNTSRKYQAYRDANITFQDIVSAIQCVQCPNAKSLLLFLERTSTMMLMVTDDKPIQMVYLDGWDQLDLPPELSKAMYYVSMTLHYLSLLRADDFSLLLIFHNRYEWHNGLLYPANLAPYSNVGPAWSYIPDKQMMMSFCEGSGSQVKLVKNKICR